ncbi:hypothetical protein BB560_001320 [Smittium megazygosporum]|uniref:SCP domain-containing protein n=1 Tax=Smittium megazygosporum TaxID=133381 RepID=A0A2T9ZHW7_9FUNG|nr:hypothetical protein BB560_001320 [Smittium megazygosporum]
MTRQIDTGTNRLPTPINSIENSQIRQSEKYKGDENDYTSRLSSTVSSTKKLEPDTSPSIDIQDAKRKQFRDKPRSRNENSDTFVERFIKKHKREYDPDGETLHKKNSIEHVAHVGPAAKRGHEDMNTRQDTYLKRAQFSSDINIIVCETNKLRKSKGLNELKVYPVLNDIALRHSQFMEKNKNTTHWDPNGTLGTRLTALKIGWVYSAENVASGFTDPSKVVKAWINSPTHYANLVSNRVTSVGIGRSGVFWTQNFIQFPSSFNPSVSQVSC